MKNKKLTYEELKEELKIMRFLFVAFFVLALIFCVLFITFGLLKFDLQQELEKCQEEREVWSLKIGCDYGPTKWNTTYNFNSYSLYKGFLENFEEDWNKENCEVIE